MNRYRLVISPFAEDDLQVSKEWYDLQKKLLGKKFINEVEKTLQIILLNPFQFPKNKGEIRRAPTQKFSFWNILFYYRGYYQCNCNFSFQPKSKNLEKQNFSEEIIPEKI